MEETEKPINELPPGIKMNPTGRRGYSSKFKAKCISQVLNDGISPIELGAKYGIPYNNISRWVRKANGRYSPSSSKKKTTPENTPPLTTPPTEKPPSQNSQLKIKKLKNTIKRLKAENEILRQAMTLLFEEKATVPKK